MKSFEVLCVTMHQTDMSLYEKMKLDSDVIFANQCDVNNVEYTEINGHSVTMYFTATRGVGINRNIALLNASADICLLADDDMTYEDGYAQRIAEEFDRMPHADVIIFNIGTTTPEFGRLPTQIKKRKRLRAWSKNPYGAPRIAFRLSAIKKYGVFFSLCFGGGTLFPSGEDTLWLDSLRKAGARIYLSPVSIGNVSYAQSTWMSEDGRMICFGRGALLEARKLIHKPLLIIYYATLRRPKGMGVGESLRWLRNGICGFRQQKPYAEFIAE